MSIRDDLKAYLDGELTEERAAEVRAALEKDPELRREADEIKALGDTLKTANIEYVAVGLENTLVALQRASKPQPIFRVAKYRWLFAGAAGLLIIGTLVIPFMEKGRMSGVAYSPMPTGGAALKRDVMTPSEMPAEEKTQAPMAQVQAQAKSARPGEEFDADTADQVTLQGRRSVTNIPKVAAKGGRSQSAADSAKVGLSGTGSLKAPADQPKPMADVTAQASGNAMDSNAPAAFGARGGAAPDTAKAEASPAPAITARKSVAMMKVAKDVAPPRLIINNGDVGVYVKDVKGAKSKAESFARASGGYVQTSDLEGDKAENQVANLTLRVPVASYNSVLQQVKNLGSVNRDSSTGTDVTSQVVDTEARLKTMKAEETQYRDIMKQAHKISDVLEVKDKLSDVRQQIESLDAQAKSLRNQATLSTITVSFSVKPKENLPQVGVVQTNSWLGGTVGSAIDSFVDIAKALATILIFLLVFLPLWGPVAALSFWGYRVSRPQYRY